jgi:AcrR family transcriptional regulator
VSVGTFYQHFENKADLLRHLIEVASEAPIPVITSAEHFERQIVAYVASPEAGVWRAWQEAILAEPDLREIGAQVRRFHRERFERWIREIRATHGVRNAPVDDESAAWVVMTALTALVIEAETPGNVRKISSALWQMLFGL